MDASYSETLFTDVSKSVVCNDSFQYNSIQIMPVELDYTAGGCSISKFTSMALINLSKSFHFLL